MPRALRPTLCRAVVTIIILGAVFGTSCGPVTSTSNSSPTNPAATFDISNLDFETPELKERFFSFDRAARATATDNRWKHRGYTEGGNFISAVWALGEGYDADCHLSREPEHQVGTRQIRVDTIVVAAKAKSAALTFELVAASPREWSLFGNYREAAEQGVSGAGWGITIFKWDADKQHSVVPYHPYEETIAKLEFGPRYSYKVGDTLVEDVSELPQEQDFIRYLISADSLRDVYLTASGHLLKKVEETIAEHTAEKRIFGKYNGDGRPPPSHLRKLTKEEEAEELTKARDHFARLVKIVNDEHKMIHTALRKAFPFEKCWAELNATGTTQATPGDKTE